MSKDIKKALEHCIEWNCVECPNREELGSGEIVCRGRLLPEVLEYVADLESKLAESEKQIKDVRETANMSVDSWCKNRRKYEAQIAEMQNKSFILYSMLYETLEKQGCENVASQIDQMTGWTYDKEADWLKGNRNYDQLKQQLAESENQCRECKHLNKKIELNIKNKLMAENCELQKQLAEKDKEIDILKTALGQASIEAFGKKESFVSSNYPKKIANANEYMEFLIYIASKEKENGNKK